MPPEAAEIDWEDENAVRALRGDEANAEEETTDGVQQTEGDETAEKEVEAEAEKETDVEAEAEAEPEPKEPMIPKSRLDSKSARVRELEARLAEYEQQQQQVSQQQQQQEEETREQALNTTIIELDSDINQAIADDDMERATFLRQEQRKLERELFLIEAQQADMLASEQTRENLRLEDAIASIEREYPMLNPRSEEYDVQLIERVQELRYGLQNSGHYTPTQALITALSYLMPSDQVAEPTEPPVEAGNKRQSEALKKAVDSAKKQPASTKDVGLDADKAGIQGDIDPTKLTIDDLEKLPLDTLRRLRGDLV